MIVDIRDLEIGYAHHSKHQQQVGPKISVNASKGELIAVIGPNGCGKSTLLKTITRLQPALGGKLLINDLPIKKIDRENFASILSFVSTEPIRVAQMTVHQLISLGRFPYTNWIGSLTEKDYEVVDESLKLVGLNEMAQRFITELSDGERQRIMIARALAQDTPIIILDEPTAFLDLPNKYDIVHLLHDLAASKNKTILFSTHDLNIALSEADKVWLFTPNNVIQGSPEDLMLDKAFDDLFGNRLQFDWQSGSYRKNKTIKKKIKLSGSQEKLILLTGKALDRLGYSLDPNADIEVSVSNNENISSWEVKINGKSAQKLKSIYDLSRFLRF